MRLNSISQFKALVGQEVICIPTGNAARGRDNNYFETKTVVSVGRKYVKLKDYREDEYRAEDGATRAEVNRGYSGNSGYIFFATEEDYQAHKQHCNLAQQISRKTNYFDWSGLSAEDLLTVKKLLGL